MSSRTMFENVKRAKDSFEFNPEECIVIGLDEGGPGDLHYDPRVLLPVDMLLVDSLKEYKQQQPGKVLRDADGRPIVVQGRQRVRALRVINEQRVEAGLEPLLFHATVVSRGTSQIEIDGGSIVENTMRRNDDALVLAEKVAVWIQTHGEDKESMRKCSVAFGVPVQRLYKLLTLREAHPAILRRIKEDSLGIEAALAIASVPVGEQVETLTRIENEAIEAGRTTKSGKARISAADMRRGTSGRAIRPAVKAVRDVVTALAAEGGAALSRKDAAALLLWVIGDTETNALPDSLKAQVRKAIK